MPQNYTTHFLVKQVVIKICKQHLALVQLIHINQCQANFWLAVSNADGGRVLEECYCIFRVSNLFILSEVLLS